MIFNHRLDELFLFSTIFNDFADSFDYFSEVNILNSPAKSVFKISFTKKSIYGIIKLLTVQIVVFRAYFFDLRKSLFIQQAIGLAILMSFLINFFKLLYGPSLYHHSGNTL